MGTKAGQMDTLFYKNKQKMKTIFDLLHQKKLYLYVVNSPKNVIRQILKKTWNLNNKNRIIWQESCDIKALSLFYFMTLNDLLSTLQL